MSYELRRIEVDGVQASSGCGPINLTICFGDKAYIKVSRNKYLGVEVLEIPEDLGINVLVKSGGGRLRVPYRSLTHLYSIA